MKVRTKMLVALCSLLFFSCNFERPQTKEKSKITERVIKVKSNFKVQEIDAYRSDFNYTLTEMDSSYVPKKVLFIQHRKGFQVRRLIFIESRTMIPVTHQLDLERHNTNCNLSTDLKSGSCKS